MAKQKRLWCLVDADDTILGVKINGQVEETNAAYSDVISRFKSFMLEQGYDGDDAVNKYKNIDDIAVRSYGFGNKNRFPTSLRSAFEILCTAREGDIDQDVADKVEAIGWSVFDYPYVALPGAMETLEAISHEYNIAIVTKGDEVEQNKKIFDSGCFIYADQVIVMNHKSVKEWDERVVTALRLGPVLRTHSWAIGNSVKSDINPPLKLGFNAIHIPSKQKWSFEHEEYTTPLESRVLHTVPDIRDTLKFLFP